MERIDRIEKAIEALVASQAKLEIAQLKTDEQLKKTERQLSNLGVNIGLAVEDYFYNSLAETKKFGNTYYEQITRNMRSHKGKLQAEYDIVLYNGDSIGIIEIKHRVHPTDIDKLLNEQVPNFRILFPMYKKYKIYVGIGSASMPSDVCEFALSKGVAVLQQKGDTVIINADTLIAY